MPFLAKLFNRRSIEEYGTVFMVDPPSGETVRYVKWLEARITLLEQGDLPSLDNKGKEG